MRKTASFLAADERGSWHTLHVWTEFADEVGAAIQRVYTEAGDDVDRLAEGVYRLVTGEVVTTSDPLAP